MSPEGGSKSVFFCFQKIKFNFSRIKSTTKFLCAKPPAADSLRGFSGIVKLLVVLSFGAVD